MWVVKSGQLQSVTGEGEIHLEQRMHWRERAEGRIRELLQCLLKAGFGIKSFLWEMRDMQIA